MVRQLFACKVQHRMKRKYFSPSCFYPNDFGVSCSVFRKSAVEISALSKHQKIHLKKTQQKHLSGEIMSQLVKTMNSCCCEQFDEELFFLYHHADVSPANVPKTPTKTVPMDKHENMYFARNEAALHVRLFMVSIVYFF